MIEDVKTFWHNRPRYASTRNKKAKEIKMRMLCSNPITRKAAEEEKCRELYLIAGQAIDAAERARRVKAAIRDIISPGTI